MLDLDLADDVADQDIGEAADDTTKVSTQSQRLSERADRLTKTEDCEPMAKCMAGSYRPVTDASSDARSRRGYRAIDSVRPCSSAVRAPGS